MNEKKKRKKGTKDCFTIILERATNDVESQFTLRSKTFLRFFKGNEVNFYHFSFTLIFN